MTLKIYTKNNRISTDKDELDKPVDVCAFTVKSTPEDATIKINGVETKTKVVEYGSVVSYEASKDLYVTEKGNLKVCKDIELNVEMVRVNYDFEFTTPGTYTMQIDRDSIYSIRAIGAGGGSVAGHCKYNDSNGAGYGSSGSGYDGGEFVIPAGLYTVIIGAGGLGKSYNPTNDTGIYTKAEKGTDTKILDSEGIQKLICYGGNYGASGITSANTSANGTVVNAANIEFTKNKDGTAIVSKTYGKNQHIGAATDGPGGIIWNETIYGRGGDVTWNGLNEKATKEYYGGDGYPGYLKLTFINFVS